MITVPLGFEFYGTVNEWRTLPVLPLMARRKEKKLVRFRLQSPASNAHEADK
jgi:hypothetical protein